MSLIRVLLVALVGSLAVAGTLAVGAAAAGPTAIELISPVEGSTVHGVLRMRAKVTGPAPGAVQFHFNPPPKGWQQAGTLVSPGIWEATYDLSAMRYGTFSASAWAVTPDSTGASTFIMSGPTLFTVDREFTLRWAANAVTVSPDADGIDDETSLTFLASGVPLAAADLSVAGVGGAVTRTITPARATGQPSGDGVGLASWDGRDAAGQPVPDGWYCARVNAVGANGRHDSLARPVIVDAAPAELVAPPSPPAGWCAAPAVPEDPPFVDLADDPLPPLPAEPKPTTPDALPTTPAGESGTTGDSPVASASYVPTLSSGPLATTAPVPGLVPAASLSVRSGKQSRGRLRIKVRCTSGCEPKAWVGLELWTVGTKPSLRLSLRVRVSVGGTISVDRPLVRRLPRSLELRAPALGVRVRLLLR